MAAIRPAGFDFALGGRVRDPREIRDLWGAAKKELQFIEKRDLGQRLPPGVVGGAAGR